MIILITGASHTGKTALAQKLLERYRYPVLSLDLLKMGLIRSGQTSLAPEDDGELAPYLWSIASEIIKTAIENNQNLIVEGCYIPFDWKESFSPKQLEEIESCCLVMTRRYLTERFDEVRRYANIVEKRMNDDLDLGELAHDNERNLDAYRKRNQPIVLIDGSYETATWSIEPLSPSDARKAALLFHRTVHAVNAHDYRQDQLDAWAPGTAESGSALIRKLLAQRTIGIKECGILIGFGSLDDAGELDMLYAHRDRQGQGIGSVLADRLEQEAAARGWAKISAYASITARPFFERRGYRIARENIAVRDGIALRNYLMTKELRSSKGAR